MDDDSDNGGRCHPGYARRVLRALNRRRLGAAALACVLLSLEALASPDLFDFFAPSEVALAWLERFAELAVVTAALVLAYTLADEALERAPPRWRLASTCVILLALSLVLSLALYGYYAHGFEHLPPAGRMLSDALRIGLPAVALALLADVHRRALQVDCAARAAELTRVRLRHDEAEQQLALLQAQIEPHFLFNVLGNVRRLYRTQPPAGADAIRSLMHYLRAALPQLRTARASVGSEVELVRSYLALLQVRMGSRLACVIDVDPHVAALELPPVLLITLVENAIKHGIEPVGRGSVHVQAWRRGDELHCAVTDDGAGLGGAASEGTGLGLANVRRRLMARYGARARVALEPRSPRGARATIMIPLRPRAGDFEADVGREAA